MVASRLTKGARVEKSLTLRYLKRRLKRLNRRVKSPKVTVTDTVMRDRVAAQLEEAEKFLH